MAEHDSITPLRLCSTCGAWKPLTRFVRDASKRTGYRSYCKACDCAKTRERRRAYVASGNELIPRDPQSAYTRFDAQIDIQPEGCWSWVGPVDDKGYGLFSVNGTLRAAHRFSYVRHRGAIPNGLHLDHLCRNPSCVNPAHLEPVTLQENLNRGNHPNQVAHRENRCVRGHSLSDPANIIHKPNGGRQCRTCTNAKWREAHQRRKARKAND